MNDTAYVYKVILKPLEPLKPPDFYVSTAEPLSISHQSLFAQTVKTAPVNLSNGFSEKHRLEICQIFKQKTGVSLKPCQSTTKYHDTILVIL